MLMGNPGALNDLSKNEGPCHICNSINHPTLRCHILGADEGTLHPDIRTGLDDLKQRLMENKKEQQEQHVDSDDDALLPLPLTVEEDKLDETADTDAEDDEKEERAQLVADIKLLQEGLMTILHLILPAKLMPSLPTWVHVKYVTTIIQLYGADFSVKKVSHRLYSIVLNN